MRAPAQSGRGSIVLGIVVGMAALAFFGWLVAVNVQQPEVSGAIGTVSFIAYVVAAVIFSARQKTSRFGTGLLLAIGAWVLVGAGLCFAMVARVGQ